MVVSGKIKVIQEVEEKGTFKSRNVVVTTEEQYPQHISIQFVQDKCSILDSYAVGQSVEVSINLRGREWIDPQGVAKYFNTIQGWKINKVGDDPVAETATDEDIF
jgi:hypothetical protein